MICEVKSLLLNQFKIKNLICDFEISIRLAFENNFLGIHISHCLFHFGQIVWRKLAKNQLSTLYRQDTSFRFQIKKLLTSSFLPKIRN